MQTLYVFYTHKKNLDYCFNRIKEMMKNQTIEYLIVCGGENTNYNSNNKILTIECNDYYEGLPEKVLKSFKYLVESYIFKNFNYFVKLDEDMIVKKQIPESLLIKVNYCGRVQRSSGNRRYHFGKFSKDHPYYNKKYQGKYVPWCLGGYGYIISRKAIELIKEDVEFVNAIYEDVYIAILLNKHNIFPKNINIKSFFYSPTHK